MGDDKTSKSNQRRLMLKTLNLGLEFGFIIALPLVALGLLGKYIDQRHHTKYFVLIGILLALTTSSVWFYKRIKDILNDLRKQ